MAYFLEFMERRSRSRLVQFWLTIEGFKDPLEAAGRFTAIENTSSAALRPTNDSEAAIIAEDVSFLYLAYFAEHDEINNLGVPQKYQKIFKDFAQRADYDRSGQSVTEVKLAMFSAQDAAYAQMEEDDWPGFRKTELHRKALANLEKVSAPKPPAFPPPPQRSSSSAITIPPPHPARQNTAPALLAGLTSPSQRAAPRLINGNFAPSAAKLESAISIAPPRFERVTSSGSQESDSGHHHLFKASLDGDSPHMKPSLTRGSSHFDVLMSASQQKERDPLFEDDGDEGLQDNDALENQRMEAIQAALNEIIATDDMTASRMSLTNPMTPGAEEMRSPSASMISLGPRTTVIHPRLASKSVEDLKSPKDLGASGVLAKKAQMDDGPKVTERKSMSSLSPVEKRPSRVLFDDDVLDEDEADDGTEATDKEGIPGAMVRLAEPGNLQLGPEIARLQDRIQELIKQGRVLETLISQAELTGNQAELRLLRRSQSAVRQETRACIFQKAQYDQQEEENRLVPGRTRLSVPSHIDTLDEGKQVVRYVVRIDQVDDEGQTLLSWNVARRYNEFHDLDKGVRDWAIATGDKQILGAVKRQIAELPGKKLVPVLSSQQLDARRSGLERYLKVSIDDEEFLYRLT
jgi:sorting nexin-25